VTQISAGAGVEMGVVEPPWRKMSMEAVVSTYITQQHGHSLMGPGQAIIRRSAVGIAR
jgi:hypothetical protein